MVDVLLADVNEVLRGFCLINTSLVRLAVLLRPCAFPVTAAEVDIGAVKIRHAGVIELIGDFCAGDEVFGVSGGIELFLFIAADKGGVSVSIHAVSCGIALCSKDVVESRMAVGTDSEVVGTGVYNVCLGTVGIISAEGFFRNLNAYSFVCSRGNVSGFYKSAEFDGRLFNEICTVIIRVGGLHVDFDDILSSFITDVVDRYLHCEGIGIFCQRIIGIGKVGVAEAVTEGILHLLGIVIFACFRIGVALPEDGVFITGFVITVTDVDVLSVNGEGVFRALFILGVREFTIVKNLGSRSAERVKSIGVDQAARGVDLTGQCLGDRADTFLSGITDPEAGLYIGEELRI